MSSNKIAPEGQVYVCSACGKQSQDEYGEQAISFGWDESCTMHAVLCYADKDPEGIWVAVDKEKPRVFRINTATGSVYELNTITSKIRRVKGEHPPTPNQGPDGEWKEYEEFFGMLGMEGLIVWSSADKTATRISVITNMEPI